MPANQVRHNKPVVGRAHKEFNESFVSAVHWDTVANYEMTELDRRVAKAEKEGAEDAQTLEELARLKELAKHARQMKDKEVIKVTELHDKVVKLEEGKKEAKEHFHGEHEKNEVRDHSFCDRLRTLSRAHDIRMQARTEHLYTGAPTHSFPCDCALKFGRPSRKKPRN